MNKIKAIINKLLERIGKKELIVLSFEKKNVSFTGFNLKQISEIITFLNNNLIGAYEDGDILSAKRIRSMLIEIADVKLKLENRIKQNNPEDDLASMG